MRQARYHALAKDVGVLALRQRHGRLKLLDIGLHNGCSMRHIEVQAGAENIDYHGVDIRFRADLYRPDKWQWHQGDLLEGLSLLPSESFDVVICEQVLEHLPHLATPLATLDRLLRPGGWLFVGVPIFPPGIHLLRRHLVPLIDRVVPRRKPRGHVQAFCAAGFCRLLAEHGNWCIRQVRGFRIVSGGLLRPLENQRWWWRLNCKLGEHLPSLCTEVQVVATKQFTDEAGNHVLAFPSRRQPTVRWEAA